MDKLIVALGTALVMTGTLWAVPGETGDLSHALPTPTLSSSGTGAVAAKESALLPPYEQYSYFGERYRDPFIPLAGQPLLDPTDHAPQTSSLALKGIIRDAQGRMALLASGMSTYILKSGRLYDGRNKIVKGISGVIKQDSVVVVGANRAVRELKVKAAL